MLKLVTNTISVLVGLAAFVLMFVAAFKWQNIYLEVLFGFIFINADLSAISRKLDGEE